MKRLFIIIMFLALFGGISFSQQKSEQDFTFVYIAHDTDTPTQQLINKLKDIRKDAVQTRNPIVFFLSAGDNPVVVRINMKDDNRNDFEEVLLRELNEKDSHDIISSVDVQQICDLFNAEDFDNGDGELAYSSVSMDFYVSPKFWELQNNEKIISTLYFALELEKYPASDLYFNVIRSKNDQFNIDMEKPFGDKNLGGLNQKFRFQTY